MTRSSGIVKSGVSMMRLDGLVPGNDGLNGFSSRLFMQSTEETD